VQYLQVKDQQPSSSKCQPSTQPTVNAVFDKAKKYDPTSKEAVELNEAVAYFICKDQVSIYTVEKDGFKSLIRKLNARYQLPSRKYFMDIEIPKLYESVKAKVQES